MAFVRYPLSVELVVSGVGDCITSEPAKGVGVILSIGFVDSRGWALANDDGGGCPASTVYYWSVWSSSGFRQYFGRV